MSKSLFLSPLTPKYWQAAVLELKNLRTLTFAALMVSASIVISSFFIPVSENLRVYFSFIATATCSLVGGPIVALLYGFVSDILGFIIHPTGGFFPGYTLNSMLGALIFALFLYRQRINVLRIALAKFMINLFVNVGLGSLWSAILSGKGYYYFFAKSIIKNTLLLPVEILLLVMLFQVLLPVLSRSNMIGSQETRRITLF